MADIGHSHGTGRTPPAPHQVRQAVAAIIVPMIVATVAGLIIFWPRQAGPALTDDDVPRLRGVVQTTTPPCASGTPAVPGGDCGNVTVRVRQADSRSSGTVNATVPSGKAAPVVEPGDKVVLAVTADPQGGPETYVLVDHDRGTQLIWLLIAFCAAIVAFGRWSGVASLGGLALSFAVLLAFILPAIQRGEDPLWVAIIGAAAIMFGVLYLTHGVSVPTSIAILGTLGALILTGLLGLAVTAWMDLNGTGSEETILLNSALPDVDLRGLLLAGIIIGTLGVLDDVTVTQTAIVGEIAAANPSLPARHLYSRAIRVGRSHIGSAVNTIILAYAGASLPHLLLIATSSTRPWDVLTSQAITTEIVRGVVGTLGLVAAVPITTALAAWIVALSHRAS
jgi:uncharacterized membrane protein